MKRYKKNVILFLLCILSIQSVVAKTFYVSAQGRDENTGITPKQPWRTLQKVNQSIFSPGDTVLFQRGDKWFGQLLIRQSGDNHQSRITYGAYGSGNKPVISGAFAIKGWKPYQKGIYVAQVKHPVHALYIDGEVQTLARFPDQGFLSIDSAAGKNYLLDQELVQPAGYWKGASARMRTVDWAYETRPVDTSAPGVLTFLTSVRYPLQKGFGYYLDNSLAALDAAGEWYYDAAKQLLYYKPGPGQHPDKLNIEGSAFETGADIAYNMRYLHIRDLVFEKFSRYGLQATSVRGVHIASCYFQNIGHAGIQISAPESAEIHIDSSRFEHILGRGISLLAPAESRVMHNEVKNIGLLAGYGVDGINNAVGILLEGGGGNMVAHNQVDSTGYIGIRVDGNANVVEYNLVKNVMLKYKDGAGIYCFGVNETYTFSSVIRHNIVINAVGSEEATPHKNPITHGIYLDNRVHDMLVEHNLVMDAKGAGILINDHAYRNTIKNNVTYNCGSSGIEFSEWATKAGLHSNEISKNIFITSGEGQYAVVLQNFIHSVMEPGTVTNNTMIGKRPELVLQRLKVAGAMKEAAITISSWEKQNPAVQHNTFVPYSHQPPLVLVNHTAIPKEQALAPGNFTSLEGKKISGKVLLQPFQWMVLLQE